MKNPQPRAETPFEAFVQRIAAVPKADADKIEAERPKRLKRKRKTTVKK